MPTEPSRAVLHAGEGLNVNPFACATIREVRAFLGPKLAERVCMGGITPGEVIPRVEGFDIERIVRAWKKTS